MKDWIARQIETLATKFVGNIVSRALTGVAVLLVGRHWMKSEQSDNWVAANADWITGLVLGALSEALSRWRKSEKQKVLEAALYTAPPGYVLLPVEQAPQQNFTGGGIRAGEESIAPDKFRPEEHL